MTSTNSNSRKLIDCAFGQLSILNTRSFKMEDQARDCIQLGSIVRIQYQPEKRYFSLFVVTNVCDSTTCQNGKDSQQVAEYLVKMSNKEVTRDFVLYLLKEIENIAAGLDLALAQMSVEQYKQHAKHVGCLRRKLVDLYTVCKPVEAEILLFIRERLANVSVPTCLLLLLLLLVRVELRFLRSVSIFST